MPESTQVYLSIWPSRNCWRFVPLSTSDSRTIDIALVVDHERAAFAADEVLRLVKAQRGEPAERTERPVAVRPEEAVRVVLDHRGGRVGEDRAQIRRGRNRCPRSERGQRRGRGRRASRRALARIDAERVGLDVARRRMRAPVRANASAVETKVNDGTMTTSSGPRSRSSAAASSASVHDEVISTSARADLGAENLGDPIRKRTSRPRCDPALPR